MDAFGHEFEKNIILECILRGSQARKSAFWVDCTFKSVIEHVFVPVYYIECSIGRCVSRTTTVPSLY